MSLPYFREYGWDPVVLAVDADCVNAPRDPRLTASLPTDVPVHRVRALSSHWTRRVGLGNIGYRAWFQLDAMGRRLLNENRFDLVYFSTTQFIATTLGRRWRRQLGTPYVIDIQDPWRSDYYDRPGAPPPPGGWKYRFARWQANRLEERAWHDAAGFISVSPYYLENLRERYVWFGAKPAETIPFGASVADFAFVRGDPSLAAAFTREPETLHLVNVGAVGAIMRPALETLFAGLAAFRIAAPEAAARLRLHFIGTSYAPAGHGRPSALPVAQAHGVADLVREQPDRIGYFAAIKTMLEADALLLPGSGDPGYSPSKIGGCFLAHQPTLALVPTGSTAAKRIDALGFARVVSPNDIDAVGEVVKFLHDLTHSPELCLPTGRNERRFASEDTAEAITRRQCALFDQATTAIR